MQKCTRINLHTDRLFQNPAVSRSVVHIAVAVRRWPNQDALLQVKNKGANTFGVVWRLSLIEVGRKGFQVTCFKQLVLDLVPWG